MAKILLINLIDGARRYLFSQLTTAPAQILF